MALEDAKNAKSTVRLKRDSTGSYGYVYTADKDAITNAEQAVADADIIILANIAKTTNNILFHSILAKSIIYLISSIINLL